MSAAPAVALLLAGAFAASAAAAPEPEVRADLQLERAVLRDDGALDLAVSFPPEAIEDVRSLGPLSIRLSGVTVLAVDPAADLSRARHGRLRHRARDASDTTRSLVVDGPRGAMRLRVRGADLSAIEEDVADGTSRLEVELAGVRHVTFATFTATQAPDWRATSAGAAGDLPTRLLGSGTCAQFTEERTFVFRDAPEWEHMWWMLTPGTSPRPAVDFDREMVIGVIAGPSWRAGVEPPRIDRVSVGGPAGLVLREEDATPGDAWVVPMWYFGPNDTQYWTFVAVPRFPGEIHVDAVLPYEVRR